MINENILRPYPQQIEAVTHKDDRLWCLVGGYRKTKTLTSRVAYLIKNEGINPGTS